MQQFIIWDGRWHSTFKRERTLRLKNGIMTSFSNFMKTHKLVWISVSNFVGIRDFILHLSLQLEKYFSKHFAASDFKLLYLFYKWNTNETFDALFFWNSLVKKLPFKVAHFLFKSAKKFAATSSSTTMSCLARLNPCTQAKHFSRRN